MYCSEYIGFIKSSQFISYITITIYKGRGDLPEAHLYCCDGWDGSLQNVALKQFPEYLP